MSTFVETMLGAPAGQPARITPDLVVVNDGICHTAVEMAGMVRSPAKVRVIFDHDVPTGQPEAAWVFGEIRRFAKSNGMRFIQAQGVGYQYLLEQEVRPGMIAVQGGSHASIYGSVGALGINVSATELARVLEHDYYNAIVPETVTVRVEGTLPAGTTMMDAAMVFLSDNPCLAGKSVEFSAPTLDAHQKAVLCSMACETGAFCAAVTDTEGRDVTLDLSQVVPMVTMPCPSRDVQKDAVRQPKEVLQGMKLQAGQIGGYTGGTIEDLRLAASLIEGKTPARGFRLTIAPATSADYLKALDEGLIERFIDFGAQISAVGDHSVVTQGAGVIGKGEKLLTTGLYTYAGCMGVEDSEVYTGSVPSVMAAAVTGQV